MHGKIRAWTYILYTLWLVQVPWVYTNDIFVSAQMPGYYAWHLCEVLRKPYMHSTPEPLALKHWAPNALPHLASWTWVPWGLAGKQFLQSDNHLMVFFGYLMACWWRWFMLAKKAVVQATWWTHSFAAWSLAKKAWALWGSTSAHLAARHVDSAGNTFSDHSLSWL